jgi:hypothetical protein
VLPLRLSCKRPAQRLLHFETRRIAYANKSAIAAIQWLLRGSPQWAGYLPVSAKAGRTAASSFDECVLCALGLNRSRGSGRDGL